MAPPLRNDVKRNLDGVKTDLWPLNTPPPTPSPLRRSYPVRATRRPVNYTFDTPETDSETDSERASTPSAQPPPPRASSLESTTYVHDYDQYLSTDSEAEENARIERSMGVIRKMRPPAAPMEVPSITVTSARSTSPLPSVYLAPVLLVESMTCVCPALLKGKAAKPTIPRPTSIT